MQTIIVVVFILSLALIAYRWPHIRPSFDRWIAADENGTGQITVRAAANALATLCISLGAVIGYCEWFLSPARQGHYEPLAIPMFLVLMGLGGANFLAYVPLLILSSRGQLWKRFVIQAGILFGGIAAIIWGRHVWGILTNPGALSL
jgi:hypothetical protein